MRSGRICTVKFSTRLPSANIVPIFFPDTVPVEDYLDENGWVSGDRSDILIEESMQKAQVHAGRRYNEEHNKSVFRFIMHPKSHVTYDNRD